jgi:N-acetylglucosamine kinase
VVLNTVGASAVPVAGGLANADRLVAALDRMVRSRLLRRAAGPLLVRAGHRDAPGLIGAAMLGWESAGDGPRSG